MAVILTPGCAEVRLVGLVNGMDWVIIQHAQSAAGTSPIPGADLDNLLAAVATGTGLTAQFAPTTNANCTISEVSVRDVGTEGAISIVEGVSIAGTAGGDVSNSATSALVRNNIGYVPTFKRPGRTNWPGVLDSSAVENILSDGAITGYEALQAAFLADINAAVSGVGNWTAVVRSLYFGSGGGTPGHPVPHPRETGVTAPIISSSVRPKISGLNRRLRGGKRRR